MIEFLRHQWGVGSKMLSNVFSSRLSKKGDFGTWNSNMPWFGWKWWVNKFSIILLTLTSPWGRASSKFSQSHIQWKMKGKFQFNSQRRKLWYIDLSREEVIPLEFHGVILLYSQTWSPFLKICYLFIFTYFVKDLFIYF